MNFEAVKCVQFQRYEVIKLHRKKTNFELQITKTAVLKEILHLFLKKHKCFSN